MSSHRSQPLPEHSNDNANLPGSIPSPLCTSSKVGRDIEASLQPVSGDIIVVVFEGEKIPDRLSKGVMTVLE